MWLFFPNSMLSIVQHRDKKELLIVRARMEGDIEAIFPEAKGQVTHTTDTDYPYRVLVSKKVAAQRMHDQVMGINYPNFKDSVRLHHRKMAFSLVWSILIDKYQKVDSLFKFKEGRFDCGS